jgi:transcriptional regulator with XRE-family HTH domain
MTMILGLKIKKLRELKNFTQEYMAEGLQITQAGYSKIETGETDVSYSRLEQIAKILEVKVEDITSFDDKVVFNNFSSQAPTYNGYVNNFTHIEQIHQLYQEQIANLKSEIEYLRSALEKSLK